MSKLAVKSLDRSGNGLIESGDLSIQVEIKRLEGRSSYAVLVDGVCKGISRATPKAAWMWLIEYFGVWSIDQPEQKPRKQRKSKQI